MPPAIDLDTTPARRPWNPRAFTGMGLIWGPVSGIGAPLGVVVGLAGEGCGPAGLATLQEAVESPRIWTQGHALEIEAGFPAAVFQALADRGHPVASEPVRTLPLVMNW